MLLVRILFIVCSCLSVVTCTQPVNHAQLSLYRTSQHQRVEDIIATTEVVLEETPKGRLVSGVLATQSLFRSVSLDKVFNFVAFFNQFIMKLWTLLFASRRMVGDQWIAGVNDHIECDVRLLQLADWKMKKINDTLAALSLRQIQGLDKKAQLTSMPISPNLIYRYLASVDWADKYNGKKIEDAVVSTIEWRENFGIHSISTSEIAHLVSGGLGYVGNQLDCHGRSIIYVKVGRNKKMETNALYQKLLMYTVERADRMSVECGNGEFVTIIDLVTPPSLDQPLPPRPPLPLHLTSIIQTLVLTSHRVPSSLSLQDGFSFANSLPIPTVKECLNLLKHHYPYRLGGVFIVNGSPAFNLMWGMIKPILPRRALGKTFVLGRREASKIMCEKLGKVS